jgi:SAM-dependent methyltransferase
VTLDLHYVDPRLVALYDRDNPRGADTDFYLRLAADVGAGRILDLGCGTGLLTRELATPAREVTGIDPAAAMLAAARRGPGADRVAWVEGDSAALGTPDADLAVMTGNVAQVFLDDGHWETTLRHLHAALRPGGHLAFESRNPDVRAWEGWHRDATQEQVDTPDGTLECWMDVIDVRDGLVHLVGHNVFLVTGEDVVVHSRLRFRSRTELTHSLGRAGFAVEHVYGDWDRGPVTDASRVLVFVARRS